MRESTLNEGQVVGMGGCGCAGNERMVGRSEGVNETSVNRGGGLAVD